MSDPDLILLSQSDVANFEQYAQLPLNRIELYEDLVFPRMCHYGGGFRSHLDLLNGLEHDMFYFDADYADRRRLYNIWNMAGFVGAHLANYLAPHGFRTHLINNIDSEWDHFCDAYASCREKPLVGISTTFHLAYSELSKLTKRLRKVDPEMDIVAGGAYVNVETINKDLSEFERPMRKMGVRYILHGFNSESDLLALMQHRKKGEDLTDVPNLAYLAGSDPRKGDFHVTEKRWNTAVLNETPACWHELDMPFIKSTIQMRTASGCPFDCAFCSYPDTAGGSFLLDLDLLEPHLESALKVPGVRNIIFIDDTFNVPKGRFKEMCKIFCKYDFEWFSFLRCQFIDQETAHLMKDSGCVGVYLGVESASDKVLKNMNKRATREKFLYGAEYLQNAGIACAAAFVLGFPGETEETIQEDIDFLDETGIQFYTLKEFYYMEHTGVHQLREKYGLEGMGAKWKHNTMTSDQAREYKLEMFKSIKSSTFIDPDTSLWHLAYLYDQGWSIDKIKYAQTEMNAAILDQLNGNYGDDHPSLMRLKHMLRKEAVLQ